MKFQFDLLPGEYRCLPRDNFGIILGTVAIIVCFSSISTLYLKNSRDVEFSKRQVKEMEEKIDSVYREMNQYQSPTERVIALKSTIEFINKNLETPASSWVDFLYTFESTVPEKVFVKDINPKDFSGTVRDFTVDGEAASIYDVLAFISRLQTSGSFERVFLKKNSNVESEGIPMVNFTLSFNFKGKKK